MATPTVFNLPIMHENDTFEQIELRFFTSTAEAGNEIDMTGVTPTMKIRRNNANGKVVKTLTIGSGLEWVDQANGEIRTTEFLIDFGYGDFVYDFQIAFSTTNVRTYLIGSLTVTNDIS